jgi:hypothetical protein
LFRSGESAEDDDDDDVVDKVGPETEGAATPTLVDIAFVFAAEEILLEDEDAEDFSVCCCFKDELAVALSLENETKEEFDGPEA